MHAVVFPGQGAEQPGMGLELASATTRGTRLLELASDVLGLDVPRAVLRGSRVLLDTEVLQPVLVAVGLAAAHALEERLGLPTLAMGHSLGELTAALYCCGVDDRRALAIAQVRGEAMAAAERVVPGGMIATSGDESVLARASELGLSIAAINADDETVLAGPKDALHALAAELGARGKVLAVAGPWHAPSMAPAMAPLARALEGALGPVRMPFLSAVHGMKSTGPDEIRSALVSGLIQPVHFADALRTARTHAEVLVALAPGRITRSLALRNLGVAARRCDDLADLAALAPDHSR